MAFNSSGIEELQEALGVDDSGLARMLGEYAKSDSRYNDSGQKFTQESIARWRTGRGSPPMLTVDALNSFAYSVNEPINFYLHPEGVKSVEERVRSIEETLNGLVDDFCS